MATKGKKGSVRIIGGDWRGRRFPVPDSPGLRPSGDRSRETLFNWLQPWMPGARCVDLFAGSGILGIEAASRGASKVSLIELDRKVARQLVSSTVLLNSERLEVFQGDARIWLQAQEPESLDIIFLDPPFSLNMVDEMCSMIDENAVLKPGGLIYVETSANQPLATIPAGWQLWREKIMGEVGMRLFKVSTDES